MVVASTRPEVIKLSPVIRALESYGIEYSFVTTGQHYDWNLFNVFIKELDLKEPDYNIKVGSGTQAYQTSHAMIELENLMLKTRPDVVIVEGDTNSVLSASIAAVKIHIPVAHVEAGLRSFDRTMPEEINRILADHCSEILFAPTEKSGLNLLNEGIPPNKIHIVGNTIVDATLQNLELAKRKKSSQKKSDKEYLVLTLHRAENVDQYRRLKGIIEALEKIELPIIFPVHPRTKKKLKEFKLKLENIRMIEPLGYLNFLLLMNGAKLILTDSGGIQEEAITLHIPCITLRTTTERPETVAAGGNILAGVTPERIIDKINSVLKNKELYSKMKKTKNPFGDGTTGEKIVSILSDIYERGELKVSSQDFTQGFWERKLIAVDSTLAGKKIEELDFAVIKVIEKGKEKFPYPDLELKEGQMIETLH